MSSLWGCCAYVQAGVTLGNRDQTTCLGWLWAGLKTWRGGQVLCPGWWSGVWLWVWVWVVLWVGVVWVCVVVSHGVPRGVVMSLPNGVVMGSPKSLPHV